MTSLGFTIWPCFIRRLDHVDGALGHAVGEFLDGDGLRNDHFAHELFARLIGMRALVLAATHRRQRTRARVVVGQRGVQRQAAAPLLGRPAGPSRPSALPRDELRHRAAPHRRGPSSSSLGRRRRGVRGSCAPAARAGRAGVVAEPLLRLRARPSSWPRPRDGGALPRPSCALGGVALGLLGLLALARRLASSSARWRSSTSRTFEPSSARRRASIPLRTAFAAPHRRVALARVRRWRGRRCGRAAGARAGAAATLRRPELRAHLGFAGHAALALLLDDDRLGAAMREVLAHRALLDAGALQRQGLLRGHTQLVARFRIAIHSSSSRQATALRAFSS